MTVKSRKKCLKEKGRNTFSRSEWTKDNMYMENDNIYDTQFWTECYNGHINELRHLSKNLFTIYTPDEETERWSPFSVNPKAQANGLFLFKINEVKKWKKWEDAIPVYWFLHHHFLYLKTKGKHLRNKTGQYNLATWL